MPVARTLLARGSGFALREDDREEMSGRISGPAHRLTRGRHITAVSMTLVGALLLGIVGLEIGFRLFVDVTDVAFYFWDPAVGPRLMPHQRGRFLRGNHMDGRYSVNAQGWNHPQDYVTAKSAGQRRVSLVGDSQVESFQVRPDETMYAVAERRARLSDDPVQWYAFGVSGFGTAEEYEVIRRYALDYHPDVVILLFVWNDPFDTSSYLGPLQPYTARYVLDENGELSLIYPSFWKPSFWRRLSARSALVRYLMIQKKLLDRLAARRATRTRQALQDAGLPLRETTEQSKDSTADGLAWMTLHERREKTWALIAKLLEAARDESRRRGAVFAVAYRGWADEIDEPLGVKPLPVPPNESDPFCLGPGMHRMGPDCLAPLVARLGIPYLDLTDPLREAVARTRRSHRFPDDNHYSAVGHAAAGEALAKWVETLLSARR